MVLCCFPPSTKCEWSHLRGFVDQFNKANKKTYSRAACLDVDERQTKQPELLLEADGEKPIVIEHKSIVWPPDYFSDHHNEHLLGDRVRRTLGTFFADSAYGLEVYESSLKSKTKKEIEKIAEQIARVIMSDSSLAKTNKGVSGTEPIPWRFHALSPMEREDAGLKTGFVTTTSSASSSDGLSDILSGDEDAKAGYRSQFERAAANASEKFDGYSHCLKFLLVQFHGDDYFTVDEEHLIEIIRSAEMPETIDQVWLAEPEWVNDDEIELTWRHVR